MASISSGGAEGGKKNVDHEVPLVPFIDLLFCVIMFLLATAVWNQLERVNANQRSPSPNAIDNPPDDQERVRLILQIEEGGYTLASTAGDSIDIDKSGDAYDYDQLVARLQDRRRMEPNREDIIVAPEDGVPYQEVVRAMDIAVGQHFDKVTLSDAAGLL